MGEVAGVSDAAILRETSSATLLTKVSKNRGETKSSGWDAWTVEAVAGACAWAGVVVLLGRYACEDEDEAAAVLALTLARGLARFLGAWDCCRWAGALGIAKTETNGEKLGRN